MNEIELKNKQDREQKFNDLYFGKLEMCGCGRPNEVKKFIYDLLKNHKEEKDDLISYEEMTANRKRIISEVDTDIIFEFIFHVFESKEFLEHGGSVYGSWFTDEGIEFLELLSENLTDELE